MKRTVRWLGIAIAALWILAAPACSEPLGLEREGAAPIQTDALRYVLEQTPSELATVIVYTFRNPTARTAYVGTCTGRWSPELQKEIDGEWVHAWSTAEFACLGPPIVIPPRASYTDVVWVSDCYPRENCGPKFAVEEVEGVYRLVWPVLGSYSEDLGSGELLPLDQRISNRFLIVDPR